MRRVTRLYQRGITMIAAVLITVVLAFVATAVVRIVMLDVSANVAQQNAAKAFSVANAGLQRAIFSATTSDSSQQVSCANMAAQFTNISFADGEYSVTGTIYNQSGVTLSNGINQSQTYIPVSMLTGLAPYGQVMIGSELINYGGISNSALSCNYLQPCLTSAQRGMNGTSASSHSWGDSVSQNLCQITSVGYVPNSSNTSAKRTISTMLGHTAISWVAGQKYSGELLGKWTGQSWNREALNSGIPDTDLNGIYAVSSNNIWIVGDSKTFIFWNGASWSVGNVDSSVPNVNMNDVHCMASNNCLAVGDRSGGDPTIARWNGTIWNEVTVSSLPSEDLNGISCTSSSNCWVVGDDRTFLRWDGVNWSVGNVTTSGASEVPNLNYNAVYCIAANDCWAVGDDESNIANIVHWDGTSWTGGYGVLVSSRDLNDVTCTSATDCWAVGNQYSTSYAMIIHWNGTSWTREPQGSLINVPDYSFYGIDCVSANACWAVGAFGGVIYWNGTNWTGNITNNLPTNKNLYAVSIVSPTLVPEPTKVLKLWQQQ